jgi:hypothetical protein
MRKDESVILVTNVLERPYEKDGYKTKGSVKLVAGPMYKTDNSREADNYITSFEEMIKTHKKKIANYQYNIKLIRQAKARAMQK